MDCRALSFYVEYEYDHEFRLWLKRLLMGPNIGDWPLEVSVGVGVGGLRHSVSIQPIQFS